MTLKTVAERVGVSPMTVSNAFSRPDQLSAALREKILAAAAELGYAGPDPAARTLARGADRHGRASCSTARPATPSPTSSPTAFLAVDRRGAGPRRAGPDPAAEPRHAATSVPVRDVAMDGAIIYSCSPVDEHVEWLRRRQLPLVLVDQPPDDRFPSVNVDDRAGARAAAAHLVELGHRRIAVLAAGPEALADPGRLVRPARAPARLARRAGARPASSRCCGTSRSRRRSEAYAAARELLAGPDRPTAVLAFSDALAADVLRAADDLGLRVPADVSVVGLRRLPARPPRSPRR